MNRILKFRVWDKEVKMWLREDSQYLVMDGSKVLPAPWSTISFDTEDENFVIQQFIGQLDKNNKEIYEGDILRFYTSNYEGALNRELHGRVEYNSMLARFNIVVLETYIDGCYNFLECSEMEIIGNIFENTTENRYNS